MKKSKEYKLSVWSFILAIVLYCVALVTGLIPGLSFSIDKMCMYLGFAFFGLGIVFLEKTKDDNVNID